MAVEAIDAIVQTTTEARDALNELNTAAKSVLTRATNILKTAKTAKEQAAKQAAQTLKRRIKTKPDGSCTCVMFEHVHAHGSSIKVEEWEADLEAANMNMDIPLVFKVPPSFAEAHYSASTTLGIDIDGFQTKFKKDKPAVVAGKPITFRAQRAALDPDDSFRTDVLAKCKVPSLSMELLSKEIKNCMGLTAFGLAQNYEGLI